MSSRSHINRSPDHGRLFLQAIGDLRQRVDQITLSLNGHVPTRVIDAALNLHGAIAGLGLKLVDAIGFHTGDVIPLPRARYQPRRVTLPCLNPLSREDHRRVAVELTQLRDRITDLCDEMRFLLPDTARIGRSLDRPAQAMDRLCRALNGLLARKDPDQYEN